MSDQQERQQLSAELDASHRGAFRVAGLSVEVAGKRLDDITLVPYLDPFRVQVAVSDIDVWVERPGRIRDAYGLRLFDAGSTWRLYEDDSGFRFDFYAAPLGDRPYRRLLIDRHFSRATLEISEECRAGRGSVTSPFEYPLDELLIMHRLTQEKGIELHSCGIVRPDGTGNLFVGHSGAGKSTTTRLWTAREDVEVLSDDRIIVRRDSDGAGVGTPFGAAVGADKPEVLRLRGRSASPNGHSAQDDKRKSGMRMYGTPWHGEAAYASPGSAVLARIFILEHGRGNVLTRLSPSQAVGELFARSFVPFHRHEYVDSALEFLQELVGAVPCYHYAFEPTEAAVERILEFRD
jgi:hypothetical protein